MDDPDPPKSSTLLIAAGALLIALAWTRKHDAKIRSDNIKLSAYLYNVHNSFTDIA